MQLKDNPLREFLTSGIQMARGRVRPHSLFFQSGYTVLTTNLDGELDGQLRHGLYERDTRYIAEYLWRIHEKPLQPVLIQPVSHTAMLGYYSFPDEMDPRNPNPALDIQIRRWIGPGMQESLWIKNLLSKPFLLSLHMQIGVDFADIHEVRTGQRQQLGVFTRNWDETSQRLTFDYRIAEIHHGIEIQFNGPIRGAYQQGGIVWSGYLTPGQEVELTAHHTPIFCGERHGIPPIELRDIISQRSEIWQWLSQATCIQTANTAVQQTHDSAQLDLGYLRLWEEDVGPDAWIPAAGLPEYLGIFGRDILTAGWQAGLWGPELMQGAVATLKRYQATAFDDWRDEQPGKMIHEIRHGPLSLLNHIPQFRYYGSTTSTPLFLIVLSELYHWTGDKGLLEQNRDAMEKALHWIAHYGDLDGDGFYEYQTRSAKGLRNQGWKDSNEAIVYADGRQAEPPIATCEEQAWVYEAKIRCAMMFAALKAYRQAETLLDEAYALKQQFNQAFWMPEAGFYALALDSEKRPVTSITSNPGHCLAAGIVDEDKAGPTIGRMLSPDLFSGWGIRTLSDQHPAYNPYGYHLGTVWPVENGTFCMAFVRYGFHPHANQLAEAIFSAAQCFEYNRLPEAISGHPRDAAHPFPAVYPNANMPQAWSCSAVAMMLQAILGLYPYAPLNALLLDPHLPAWLPELTVYGIRVGNARVSLHFWQDNQGNTKYRLLDKTGTLTIVPHWVNIHRFHKLKDFCESHLGHPERVKPIG